MTTTLYRVKLRGPDGIRLTVDFPPEALELAPPPKPITHGRLSSYTKRGCRCDLCRAANTAWSAEMRRRRKAATAATHDEAELEERGKEVHNMKREGSNEGLEKKANAVSEKVLAAKSKRGQDMSTAPDMLPEEVPGGEVYLDE